VHSTICFVPSDHISYRIFIFCNGVLLIVCHVLTPWLQFEFDRGTPTKHTPMVSYNDSKARYSLNEFQGWPGEGQSARRGDGERFEAAHCL
jgi:hypothetical protein